jgi:hypothetical protein
MLAVFAFWIENFRWLAMSIYLRRAMRKPLMDWVWVSASTCDMQQTWILFRQTHYTCQYCHYGHSLSRNSPPRKPPTSNTSSITISSILVLLLDKICSCYVLFTIVRLYFMDIHIDSVSIAVDVSTEYNCFISYQSSLSQVRYSTSRNVAISQSGVSEHYLRCCWPCNLYRSNQLHKRSTPPAACG